MSHTLGQHLVLRCPICRVRPARLLHGGLHRSHRVLTGSRACSLRSTQAARWPQMENQQQQPTLVVPVVHSIHRVDSPTPPWSAVPRSHPLFRRCDALPRCRNADRYCAPHPKCVRSRCHNPRSAGRSEWRLACHRTHSFASPRVASHVEADIIPLPLSPFERSALRFTRAASRPPYPSCSTC